MALKDECLELVKHLYTNYTGLEISIAIAQVRAELTAQHAFEESTESVLTYKYKQAIQDQLGPVTIKEIPKKTRCKKTTVSDNEVDQ
jgi:hypothetical protein